jgi:hypothetical protein
MGCFSVLVTAANFGLGRHVFAVLNRDREEASPGAKAKTASLTGGTSWRKDVLWARQQAVTI